MKKTNTAVSDTLMRHQLVIDLGLLITEMQSELSKYKASNGETPQYNKAVSRVDELIRITSIMEDQFNKEVQPTS